MKAAQVQIFTAMAERIERDIREIREALGRPLEGEYAQGKLTGAQRAVMRAVFHSGGVSLKDLSFHIGLSHSTVSGIVDRLVARGMLQRRVNEKDRRFTTIVVTKAVTDFMQNNALRLIAQPLAQSLSRANTEEQQVILSGLGTLRRIIGLDQY